MNNRALITRGVPREGTSVHHRTVAQVTTFSIIVSLSFCHLLNDLMQPRHHPASPPRCGAGSTPAGGAYDGARTSPPPRESALPRRRVVAAVAVLVALLFSKNVYSASLSSYYTLYLIDQFHLPVQPHSSTSSRSWWAS